jgi:hypothetical protein
MMGGNFSSIYVDGGHREKWWFAIIDSLRKFKGEVWIVVFWYYNREHLEEAEVL